MVGHLEKYPTERVAFQTGEGVVRIGIAMFDENTMYGPFNELANFAERGRALKKTTKSAN